MADPNDDVNVEVDGANELNNVDDNKHVPEDVTVFDNRTHKHLDKKEQCYSSAIKAKNRKDAPWYNRQDILVFIGGMAFIVVTLGAMFALGSWRKWDAPSGYFHNATITTMERFLPEPYSIEPGVKWRDSPGASGRWYYWRLPPARVTLWSRVFMYVGYFGHQLAIWYVTYAAQMAKAARPNGVLKFTTKLDRYNWTALVINIFFHIVHLVNTHTTYDALAQDTVEASSQGSAIMALGLMLTMEYNERGFIMGWPSRHDTGKFSRFIYRLPMDCVYVIRKYHGYAISWAAIFTFWYHPMENTYGHALGITHTWMWMLQGSLMHTKFHANRWWRFILENWVLLHGAMVAFQTKNPASATDLWPMFFFGFLGTVAFSGVYILPFWDKVKGWWKLLRLLPPAAFIGIIVGAYSQILDKENKPYTRLVEVVRIPGFMFATFFITWGFTKLFLVIRECISGPLKRERPSALTTIINMFIFIMVYGVLIGISSVLHIIDFKSTTALMFIMVFIYIIGVVAVIVSNQVMIPSRMIGVKKHKAADELANIADELPKKHIPGGEMPQIGGELPKKHLPEDELPQVEGELPQKDMSTVNGVTNDAFEKTEL
ncbi:unnamed protein product [Owenia fusiformis]|uniref:Uncharacterized protein n=1 Tax=Owenia fusiformis TaxID=6347 RepID=A0A8S4Q6U5_OWEFU|nr:unnamed protein product [Owenia fusiformis]